MFTVKNGRLERRLMTCSWVCIEEEEKKRAPFFFFLVNLSFSAFRLFFLVNLTQTFVGFSYSIESLYDFWFSVEIMNQLKTLALLLLLYLICLAPQRSSAASLLQAVRFLAEQVDTKPIQQVYIYIYINLLL